MRHTRVTKDSGMFVRGTIEGQPLEWLVDTGCTCTIVAGGVFSNIPETERPKLEPYGGQLVSADGSSLHVLGVARVNVQFGEQQMRHDVLVADVTNAGLIGTDFLRAHGMTLDFSTGSMTCAGEGVMTICRRGIERCCREAY